MSAVALPNIPPQRQAQHRIPRRLHLLPWLLVIASITGMVAFRYNDGAPVRETEVAARAFDIVAAPTRTPHARGKLNVANTALPTQVTLATPSIVQTTTVTQPIASTTDVPMDQDRLIVTFIDVAQGESIFVRAPDGKTALIDGGWDNGMALAYLQAQGVERIDVMVASHPHADHIGGLVEVLQTLPVGAVWTSGATHTTGRFEQFLDAIEAAGVPYDEVATGDQIALGDVHFDVLRSDPSASDLNDTSLVLRLAYSDVSFLFTGDAEAPSERALVRDIADRLPSTILKVGHHGSYTSSSSPFLQAVQPEVAVYSAGRSNSYGHPHTQTIAALQAVGATIYGTAPHGTVTITSDGQTYAVSTEMDGGTTLAYAESLVAGEQDHNCSDFTTQAEAMAFWRANGGPGYDPHRLDGDGDGRPCEALP